MFVRRPIEIKNRNFRLPTREETLYVVFDGGNTDVKVMLASGYGYEMVFPHRVDNISAEAYSNLVASMEYKKGMEYEETAFFSADDEYWVVGKLADGIRIKGAKKYSRNQIGRLLEAALLKAYPGGHSDVVVVVLHPITEAENLKQLNSSLQGRHSLRTPDGNQHNYKVKGIIPIEEPIAGFQTRILNTRGTRYPDVNISPGEEILVVDIGGGNISIVRVFMNRHQGIEVDLTSALVEEYGFQNVAAAFEKLAKNRFYDLIGRETNLPDNMLYNALASGKITIKGIDHECEDLVERAMVELRRRVEDVYSRFGNGTNSAMIVVTGGGGGLSFRHLEDVYNHPSAMPAEKDILNMRFSNIRGASKGLETALRMKNGR